MKFRLVLFTFYIVSFINSSSAQVVLDSSPLPIIIIDTYGQTIQDNQRITVSMGIIDNGTGNMNHVSDPPNSYNGEVTIEIRGSTSQNYPKKSYAFTPVDSSGNKKDASILGMPDESDWVLYAPYTDKTLMRNTLVYHLFNKMGHYASRTRFNELVINGSYQGVYEAQEKIKRDVNRVDISKLSDNDTLGDDLTGGYIIKIDKTTAAGNETWDSQYDDDVFFQYHDPDETELETPQKEYIQDYVYFFETALKDVQFADPDSGYRKYADENSFIDFLLIAEFARSVDGLRSSCFMYKDKDSEGGKMKMGPVWDFSSSLGNADYCDAWKPDGWQHEFNNICSGFYPEVPFWWSRLLEDSVFADNAKCRWMNLRQSFLHADSIYQWIDSMALVIDEPQQRNFQEWQILGEYVDWNYYIGQTYQDEINYLKFWITNRTAWIDDHLPGNCIATAATQNIFSGEFKISPNPSSGYININYLHEQNSILTFTDALGRVVKEIILHPTVKNHIVHIDDLPGGVYLISLMGENKMMTTKLMVTR